MRVKFRSRLVALDTKGSNAPSAAATVVKAANTETIAPADKSNSAGGCRLTDAEQRYRQHVLAAAGHRRAERRGGDRFARLVPDRAQRLS